MGEDLKVTATPGYSPGKLGTTDTKKEGVPIPGLQKKLKEKRAGLPGWEAADDMHYLGRSFSFS